MILQKYVALNTDFSRRSATELIRNGSIKVNGKLAELGQSYNDGDVITINGKEIKTKTIDKVLIKLNKPKGYVCTNRKFKDEKNVFDLVKHEGLIIVGRLDKDSRGLVLLTNDGDFAYRYTHPSFEIPKIYLVTIKDSGFDPESFIKSFKEGIDIGEGDGIAKAKDTKYLGNNKFEITLVQGKKRQIRRMFEKLGLKVIDLLRTQIGEYKLEDLKEGNYINIY